MPVGGPWEVQPGGGQFTDQLVELPLLHDDFSESEGEGEDDAVSEVGSSIATAADPADQVLNPWDFILNVLHTWGPKPEDYSPLILRDFSGDDFWSDYTLPTFSPTDESPVVSHHPPAQRRRHGDNHCLRPGGGRGVGNVQTFQVNGYFQDACTFDLATAGVEGAVASPT